MAQKPKLPRRPREWWDAITDDYTDRQIAEMWGKDDVTDRAVSKLRRSLQPPVKSFTEKATERARQSLTLHLPWSVAATDAGHELHLALKLYIRGEILREELTPQERHQLDAWMWDMDHYEGEDGYSGPVVVAYDREKGWRVVKARPSDERFMRPA